MRACSAVIFCLVVAHAASASVCDDVDAGAVSESTSSVDLRAAEGAQSMGAQWRFHDVNIVSSSVPPTDAVGQPGSGASQATFDLEPHAGGPRFDYSSWQLIAPSELEDRRGHGKLSFVWYYLHLKIPPRLSGADPQTKSVCLAIRMDDYAEIWVDGELAHPFGGVGGSVVAGWNAVNRVLLARRAHAGQEINVAIFGMNGPISTSPTNYVFLREAKLEFHAALPTPVAVASQEVNVQVERAEPAIDAIVPRNAKLYKVAEGFEFTEGPVWSRAGGYLLFSDPNHNTIYQYREDGSLRVFKDKSGYDAPDIAEYYQPGSNGLTFDRQGRLTIDEQGRHRVVRMETNGRETVLADSYRGKRLNSPNDLVVKSDGSVYFTDPPFGLPKFFDDPRKQLPFSGVFRWKNGKLDLLTRDFTGPNGLAFTPDEKYFYLDNWDAARKIVKRYPVERNGRLGKGEVFADLTELIPGEEALDGMKVDAKGNLFVSAGGDIWVFNASAKHLGTIKAPKEVHNFAWGGADGKSLYLAASSSVYRMPLLVEGVRP